MYRSITFLLLVICISGCTGVQTYPNKAQAGDTVSLAMGWQKNFKRSNTTVTITPSVGSPIIYQPGDSSVRAIINFYPDPLSNIVVGTVLENNSEFNSGYAYGSLINANYTAGDMDWWQTVAFVNLPPDIPVGDTNIVLTNASGDAVSSLVYVMDGAGEAELFNVEGNGPLVPTQLQALERASNFEISFSSDTIPYAIEMEFVHIGETYIVNPNNFKNLFWSDDGTVLKISLLPSALNGFSDISELKFYISGITALDWIQDITSLSLQSMQAFDSDGNTISGVDIIISPYFN